MQGRLYDARIGRFMQADPPFMESPGWSQGLNRYSYVFNNPLNLTDPSGFDARDGGIDSDDEIDNEEANASGEGLWVDHQSFGDDRLTGTAPHVDDDNVDHGSEHDNADEEAETSPGQSEQGDSVIGEVSESLSTGGTGPQTESTPPLDVFVYGSLSAHAPMSPASPEIEAIAVVGYTEGKGFYIGDIIATGVHAGGESNYVEALVGVEGILYLSSTEIHTETIALGGIGIGPEVPGVVGVGATAGGYNTADGAGQYFGLQGGGLGEHASLGVGYAVAAAPNLHATPSNGTEGNQGR